MYTLTIFNILFKTVRQIFYHSDLFESHFKWTFSSQQEIIVRGGSRTAETSKMERFVIIVNGWLFSQFYDIRKVILLFEKSHSNPTTFVFFVFVL